MRGSASSPLPFLRFFLEDLSALAGAGDVNENERRCGVVKAIAAVVVVVVDDLIVLETKPLRMDVVVAGVWEDSDSAEKRLRSEEVAMVNDYDAFAVCELAWSSFCFFR